MKIAKKTAPPFPLYPFPHKNLGANYVSNIKKKLATSLLAMGMSLGFVWSAAKAVDANNIFAMGGVGSSSCAKMTTDIDKFPQGAEVYRAFIDGFTAAINAAVPGKSDFLEGSDSESRYKFVLKHCENNPVDTVYQAIDALYVKVTGSKIADL